LDRASTYVQGFAVPVRADEEIGTETRRIPRRLPSGICCVPLKKHEGTVEFSASTKERLLLIVARAAPVQYANFSRVSTLEGIWEVVNAVIRFPQ
jgi:hypothetical protein